MGARDPATPDPSSGRTGRLMTVGVLAVLVAVGILAAIGYVFMIDVKPKGIVRPVLGETVREEIDVLADRLMRHVEVLAGEIGERNLFRPQGLAAAAEYIRGVWRARGFPVREEPFEVGRQRAVNLIVELPGSSRPEEIVLVGAHHDSLIGTAGANDNATGVAVLLEMPALLQRTAPTRTLRFVAFAVEEPPFFKTEAMGSRVHARDARRRGEAIVAMISLETLGYYSEAPGSQHYPFPFGAFYPDRGNFLAAVGNPASRPLLVEFLRHFTEATDFPVEGAALFPWIPGVDWSDHWSFWKEGYPALMVTDTAPYRYPHYHSPLDLPDKVNVREFARVAHGLIGAVARLAGPGTGP